MDKINAYEVRSEYFTIYSVTEDNVLDNLDKYSFNSIVCDMQVQIEEGILEYTNDDKPISIGYDYVYKNYLAISSNYYQKNKKKIDNMLMEIAANIKTVSLYLDKEFINQNLRKILIANQGIEELVIDKEKIR